MRLIIKSLVFVLVVGSFQACVSKKKYEELVAAKAATDQALAETQGQVKTLKTEKDALAADLSKTKADMAAESARMNSEISGIKANMAQVSEKLNMTEAELKKMKDELNGIFAAYSGSGMSLTERGGRLYVVTDPMTFRNGSSSLTRAQRNAIDEMAKTLKANPKAKILVEGHADNRKFSAGSGRDNWDLSVSRAKAVVTRLIKQGVDPAQLTIAGKGDTMPEGDNSTKEGREQNRRTVIVPNPDLGGLNKN